jgi:hypothetical protein
MLRKGQEVQFPITIGSDATEAEGGVDDGYIKEGPAKSS